MLLCIIIVATKTDRGIYIFIWGKTSWSELVKKRLGSWEDKTPLRM